ncbi:hypothetical protein OF83DRAFT_1285723 [Amylostereum chailletii]|nr:hypothetical protein OF83DRAFT_1285723 [Amylostereum chailletii]
MAHVHRSFQFNLDWSSLDPDAFSFKLNPPPPVALATPVPRAPVPFLHHSLNHSPRCFLPALRIPDPALQDGRGPDPPLPRTDTSHRLLPQLFDPARPTIVLPQPASPMLPEPPARLPISSNPPNPPRAAFRLGDWMYVFFSPPLLPSYPARSTAFATTATATATTTAAMAWRATLYRLP